MSRCCYLKTRWNSNSFVQSVECSGTERGWVRSFSSFAWHMDEYVSFQHIPTPVSHEREKSDHILNRVRCSESPQTPQITQGLQFIQKYHTLDRRFYPVHYGEYCSYAWLKLMQIGFCVYKAKKVTGRPFTFCSGRALSTCDHNANALVTWATVILTHPFSNKTNNSKFFIFQVANSDSLTSQFYQLRHVPEWLLAVGWIAQVRMSQAANTNPPTLVTLVITQSVSRAGDFSLHISTAS